MGFDAQPLLTGEAYHLRPLARGDYDGLRAAAADPDIWAQHPVRDRWAEAVFAPYFESLLDSRATLVIIDRARDAIIGCSRYYTAPDMPGTISIGFTFLARAYWGGSANRGVKALMLEHAFRDFDAVWFHIGPDNIRSQKGTAKLGAEYVYSARLALGGNAPDDYVIYRLDREVWRAGL